MILSEVLRTEAERHSIFPFDCIRFIFVVAWNEWPSCRSCLAGRGELCLKSTREIASRAEKSRDHDVLNLKYDISHSSLLNCLKTQVEKQTRKRAKFVITFTRYPKVQMILVKNAVYSSRRRLACDIWRPFWKEQNVVASLRVTIDLILVALHESKRRKSPFFHILFQPSVSFGFATRLVDF